MHLLIVESPAKAKTINKYLGSGYKVMASIGHVRDLPSKDGSVEPDNDFAMHWDNDARAGKVLREITDAVKECDKLILATDPDREGEAISWHLLEVLMQKKAIKKGVPVERVTFNAITKQSVLDALKSPRNIDVPLVEAYLARRALDYLVGFTLSPVLWRKLPGARSAGRVQSVVLRLVCDREAEIEAFRSNEYWTIEALLKTAKAEDVSARLVSIAGKRLEKLDIKDDGTANGIKTAIEKGDFRVDAIDKKATKRNPYPPFTTSTLQMDASRKLNMSAKQSMQVAQRLYEGMDIGGETVGLITYMRTDGVQIAPEGVAQIRAVISSEYGQNYTPFAREWKSKAKNAQEAHEAIRPTDPKRTPASIAKYVEKDKLALYDLIWKRTIASQMAPAEMDTTSTSIAVNGRDGKAYGLRATGSVVTFDGFLRVYEEGRDDKQKATKGKDDPADGGDDDSRRLPPLAVGDRLKDERIDADQHFTQPPPRFTESSLVKRMEDLGIGRPSTYASTLAVLVERDYVKMDKKALVPEDKGRLVIAFLESFFKKYVEFDFTAALEEQLDQISDGKLQYKAVLREFWTEFSGAVDGIKELRVTQVLDALNELLGPHVFPAKEDGGNPRLCPKCNAGQLSLKISGKNGAFIGCGNYPDCRYTRQLAQTSDDAGVVDGKILGIDPNSSLEIILKNGRFGPYVQLGEPQDKDDKPKRSSLPKGWDATTLDFERALKLLALPRDVGPDPTTGAMITAGLGRYGPFVKLENTYANLESIEEVFEVGVNRAVSLIADKKAGKGGRFGRAAPEKQIILDLGEHPGAGGKIEVLNGRYGPYIAHEKVYANVPKGRDPATITVADAIELINERIARGGIKVKKPAKAAKPKKAKAETASDDAAPKVKKKPAAKATKASKAAKAPKASKAKVAPAEVDD